MPKNIPIVVLTESFSLPKIRFKIKTKNGESVEIKEARPLVMYFSEYVVNPFAKTIIITARINTLKN